MKYVLLFSTVFCAALFLTGLIRGYALRNQLLDLPNERSSHARPTPRGGGLSVVLVFILALPVLSDLGWLSVQETAGLAGAGAAVAAVGWMDDLGHVSVRFRLIVHFAAAFWILGFFGGANLIGTSEIGLPSLIIQNGVIAVCMVWLLNLFNFMDGIDGIAGAEAVTACFSATFLYLFFFPGSDAWILPTILAAAVGGFLVWNWPPARIFMGDVGSGFIGLMLGAFAIQSVQIDVVLVAVWVILLGVFISDSSITLGRRILRREKFYQAHRTHAYQHASRQYGAHKPVTLTVAIINLVWLLPIAFLVLDAVLPVWVAVSVAYAPLVALALRYGAGAQEEQRRQSKTAKKGVAS
jgi:Fuc2NAc and GlcNAc transferase